MPSLRDTLPLKLAAVPLGHRRAVTLKRKPEVYRRDPDNEAAPPDLLGIFHRRTRPQGGDDLPPRGEERIARFKRESSHLERKFADAVDVYQLTLVQDEGCAE